MSFLPKQAQMFAMAAFAFYTGWKAGQKDKELDIAGEDPCFVKVDGELKPMPRTVCKVIGASKGLLG